MGRFASQEVQYWLRKATKRRSDETYVLVYRINDLRITVRIPKYIKPAEAKKCLASLDYSASTLPIDLRLAKINYSVPSVEIMPERAPYPFFISEASKLTLPTDVEFEGLWPSTQWERAHAAHRDALGVYLAGTTGITYQQEGFDGSR